jgi:hypothetical protein
MMAVGTVSLSPFAMNFRHLVRIQRARNTLLTYHRTWETGPDWNEGRQFGPNFLPSAYAAWRHGLQASSIDAYPLPL